MSSEGYQANNASEFSSYEGSEIPDLSSLGNERQFECDSINRVVSCAVPLSVGQPSP
jgi:hypothetical protein